MDRYGACTGDFESEDGFSYDCPRHGGPLDHEVDYGYGCVDGGRRSGRDHRSYNDEDTDFRRYGRPTRRGLADRHGTDPYASDALDASTDDHEYEPRNRYHGRAGEVHGDRPRHRDLSPDFLDADDESEFVHVGRQIREHRSRRGAISHRPDLRFDGEYSEDDSDSGPRATREGRTGPRLRRGAEQRRHHHYHPTLRSNAGDSEDESDGSPRERYGPGGRRAMSASYAGRRGPDHESSTDDESESEEMRGGYRAASSFGRSSRRVVY